MGELERLSMMLKEKGNEFCCWKLEGRILSLIVLVGDTKFIAQDQYVRKTYENVPFEVKVISKFKKNSGMYYLTEEKRKQVYAEEFLEMITELEKINDEE